MSRGDDLSLAFERCVGERAVLRNQLGVMSTALEEIRAYKERPLPVYVAAVVTGALKLVEQLQDEHVYQTNKSEDS